MSEDDRSRTPPRKRTSYNRRSGMAALMGELADPLPPMDDFAAEPFDQLDASFGAASNSE